MKRVLLSLAAKRTFALLGMAASTLAVPAHAAEVVDQNQPNYNNFLVCDYCVQSFVQTASNISGAGLVLYANFTGVYPVDISIWSDLPNSVSASRLAVGSVSIYSKSDQFAWYDVHWAPVEVTPGKTYYIVEDNRYLEGAASLFNSYSAGQWFRTDDQGVSFYDARNFPNNPIDLAFRTYSSSVPEPASWALMVAGFGMGGAFLRHRKSRAVFA